MVSEKIIINCPIGLHLRPAGAVGNEALKYKSDIRMVYHDGNKADMKSMFALLGAGIKCGDEIMVTCEGEDEKEALEAVVSTLKSSLEA